MTRFFCCLLLFLHACQPADSNHGDHHLLFDRNLPLVYTKHARCRMDCRHITPAEIHEILNGGEINDAKSDPNGRPDPKYAVDGYTTEKQHLRIVVAPEPQKLIVITCIELDVEWVCHCN